MREYIYVANWRWRTVFVKKATQEVAKNLKNWKEAAIKRKYWKTTKIGRIQESRTVSLLSEIKYEDYKNCRYILKIRKIFHDPDWLSSYDGPAFLIKLSLPRVQESLAAILECCEIHGKIWVFQETFLVVNMLDEILMNCAMIREIWRGCWVFWEQKELRKVKAENHFSQHLYLALPPFRQKVWTVEGVLCSWLTVPWVLGLVFKAWPFRVISPRRCICKNSRTKQNFRAGSWISEWKFAQRLAINGMGQNSYTERKTGECFQRKTIGFCSNVDICNFLHTHATGRREKEVGDVKKSHLEQVSSSVPKVKEQTDVKNSNSLKASPATWGKRKLVYGWQDEKDRHVIIGIIPCVAVTSLETVHLWHSLPLSTCWWWEVTSAPGREKKVLKEQLLFWGKKESKVVYLETQIQWILFYGKLENEIERFGGTHPEILRMHLVRIEFRERKGQSGGIIQKRWTSWAKSLRAQFLRNNTWGYLTVSILWQQSSVELGEKKSTMLSRREIWAQIRRDTSRRSKDPKSVLTATGKVQISEDARVLFKISICS